MYYMNGVKHIDKCVRSNSDFCDAGLNQNELETEGFVVVRNVVDKKTCLEFAERARRGETHAHSDLMWQIRSHPSVLKCFQQIWNTEKLISGYDGIGVGFANELDWHTDQEFKSQNCECVQSLLALTTAESTEFVNGSHLKHAQSMTKTNIPENTWQFQYIAVEEDAEISRPQLYPGDLVIWDSRTTHRVCASKKERIVVYLSMVPITFASNSVLSLRRQYFEDGISTTHWPHIIVDRGGMRHLPTESYEEIPVQWKQLIDGGFV